MLMKTSAQSLTEQLCARFGERIRNRLLAPGARLPSVRQCAQQHGVSPSTVVAAYDQLLAQGLVEARKNRGFFVRETAPARMEPAQGAIETIANAEAAGHWSTAHWFALRAASRSAPPVNATALIRGMFHKISNKPQPGTGVFPPDWLESTFLPAAVRKVTGTRALQEFSLQYGEPLGDSGLRRLLAKKLATLSVHTAPEHIITTVGATHALDIVSRTLLRAGDPDPQVFTTLAAMRMQQGRFREAAEALEAAARVGGTTAGLTAQIGFARIGNQQSEQGLALLRQAFDQNPGQLQVGTALATLLLRRGDAAGALRLAETLVRRLPDEPAAHNLLGVVRAANRQPEAARSAYTRLWDDLLADARADVRPPLLVALDNISDPRNLGAIVRSTAAFGGQGVLIPQRRSASVTAVAWRTSAGAAARLPVARATNLNRTLRSWADAGLQIVGLDAGGDTLLDELDATGPTVVVVGSEGKGLSRLVRENCDAIVSIPMAGDTESLNASVAAGVVLAEIARQRRG